MSGIFHAGPRRLENNQISVHYNTLPLIMRVVCIFFATNRGFKLLNWGGILELLKLSC